MAKKPNSADSLSAISIFVCAAESSTLTVAAQKLQMTVSGVSKAISRLEERLHVRLLQRTSRALTLTDEGLVYFQRCKKILSELAEAEAAIVDAEIQPRGHLRIQVPRALGKKIVIPALAHFLLRYSAVTIDLVLDGRALNFDQENIDLALRYGLPAQSTLIARRLAAVHFLAYASPQYLQRYGEPRSPNDLYKHRCINYPNALGERYRQWDFNANGVAMSLKVPSVLNVNDVTAAADAAANGVGIAYLTHYSAADYVRSGALRPLLTQYAFEGPPIYMLYPRRRHTPRRTTVLRDFVREVFSSPSLWPRLEI
jgi:DNA-binding transcriptional LysR family regulator